MEAAGPLQEPGSSSDAPLTLPLHVSPLGVVGEGVTRLVYVCPCSVPTSFALPLLLPHSPPPPSSPLSSSSQLPSRTCPFVDGALSSLSDTSSGPVLASPLIPFPVHTDLGLHEAGGLGACWGPLYWVNLGKEVLLVKASPEFGGHTLGPPEGGCLWAQLVGTDLQTPGWLCCDRGWVHPCPGYTVDVSGFPRSPPQSCSQTSECALRRGRKCSFITALPVTGHSSRWG